MRSTKAAALTCAFSVAVSGPSLAANPTQPDPSYSYIASDAGYLAAQGGSTASTLIVGAGYRFNRHYAIEGGYSGIFVEGISANGGYVDAYGFLPLGRRSRVSLFSTIGASYISSVYIGGTGYYASAFGVRGGGGIEWQLTDRWAVRAAVRYQTTVVNAVVTSAGFTMRF